MKGLTLALSRRFVKDWEEVDDPSVRQRYGGLSGMVGICLNLLLSAGKFAAGWLSGSLAMTADALNNLTDAGSSVVTLVGFRLAGQRADEGHPFGHGRAEYISGLIVSLIILLVGFELGKSSVEKIFKPEPVAFSWTAVVVLIAAILVKLWMWGFNRQLSKQLSSGALAATAMDSLSDSVATTAVLVGTLVGHFSKVPLDGWLGLAVAIFILRAGYSAAKDTLDPLLGQAPEESLVQSIEAIVLENPSITGLHELVVHDYGPGRRLATIHAEMDSATSLVDAHAAADAAEKALMERLHIEAVIHVDPVDPDGENPCEKQE